MPQKTLQEEDAAKRVDTESPMVETNREQAPSAADKITEEKDPASDKPCNSARTSTQKDEAQQKEKAAKDQIAKLEADLKSGGACGKNCKWITYALLAGMSMGVGSFFYASNFSKYGVIGTGIVAPGPFIMCLSIRLFMEIRYRCKMGTWFKEGSASRVRTPEGKILWKSLIPVFMNILTNAGQLIAMTFGWKFAKASGMNQGAITTLLSCASLINILVFYLMFRETISCLQFIGVSLMIGCIVCISVAATASKDKDVDEEYNPDDALGLSQTMAGILAIVCGLIGALLMSTKHLFIRMFKSNYSGVDMGVDSSLLEYAIICFFLIPLSKELDIGW